MVSVMPSTVLSGKRERKWTRPERYEPARLWGKNFELGRYLSIFGDSCVTLQLDQVVDSCHYLLERYEPARLMLTF